MRRRTPPVKGLAGGAGSVAPRLAFARPLTAGAHRPRMATAASPWRVSP